MSQPWNGYYANNIEKIDAKDGFITYRFDILDGDNCYFLEDTTLRLPYTVTGVEFYEAIAQSIIMKYKHEMLRRNEVHV